MISVRTRCCGCASPSRDRILVLGVSTHQRASVLVWHHGRRGNEWLLIAPAIGNERHFLIAAPSSCCRCCSTVPESPAAGAGLAAGAARDTGTACRELNCRTRESRCVAPARRRGRFRCSTATRLVILFSPRPIDRRRVPCLNVGHSGSQLFRQGECRHYRDQLRNDGYQAVLSGRASQERRRGHWTDG